MKTSVSVVGELDFELHSVPEARQAIFSVLRRRSLQSTALLNKAKLTEFRQMFDDAIAAIEAEEATQKVLASGDADILGETVDVLARSQVEAPEVVVEHHALINAGYSVKATTDGRGYYYVAPGGSYKSSPVFPYPTPADAWSGAFHHYERKQAKQ
jgi:coenzyme F420-reducing hydrogenase alpha subunit